MVLTGDLQGRAKVIEPVMADDERSWAEADRLKRLDWAEARAKIGLAPLPGVGDRLALVARLKTPPDRKWLAYVDGAARGMASAWEVDGVGQVEDVFVEPGFRHRGIATALIHHCVADCRGRRRGYAPDHVRGHGLSARRDQAPLRALPSIQILIAEDT